MKDSIQKVSIVGYGNVGSHLANVFRLNGVEVSEILVRESNTNNDFHFITDFEQLAPHQLVIVCVPDDQIANVLNVIPQSCPVAYTSGATNLTSVPKREHLGVFYPLQSFTKGVDVLFSEVPLFIEGTTKKFEQQLFDLAKRISRNVKYANSEERMKLHVAAVLVNNFTNHLFHLSKTYLDGQSLHFDDLKPLIAETIRKIEHESPYNAQTGPARRGDVKTINQHLELLTGIEREIYALITKSIQKTYSKND